MKKVIKELIHDSLSVKTELLNSDSIISSIDEVTKLCITCLKNGGKVILAGNGGSAADSQHIAAELVGRFYKNRKALPAIALTTDTSAITAIGNDFGFENIFSRQLEAIGKKNDIFIGISTSGNSKNILNAIELSHKLGIKTVGLTGAEGGEFKNICDITIKSPSDDIPRIQETHILIGHIICFIIEEHLFP